MTSSEAYIERDGRYVETKTKLFSKKEDCIKYAVSLVEETFSEAFGKGRTDDIGQTKASLLKDVRKGWDVFIQYPDSHNNFEFFEEEVYPFFIAKGIFLIVLCICHLIIE